MSWPGLVLDTSSNSLLSSKLSMCWECRIVDASRMSRISKKNFENLKSQKKVACYHLENEFSTFSTLDMLNNEFSTHQLYMSTSIYTQHCQPWSPSGTSLFHTCTPALVCIFIGLAQFRGNVYSQRFLEAKTAFECGPFVETGKQISI